MACQSPFVGATAATVGSADDDGSSGVDVGGSEGFSGVEVEVSGWSGGGGVGEAMVAEDREASARYLRQIPLKSLDEFLTLTSYPPVHFLLRVVQQNLLSLDYPM